jgi:hypothetical protein
LSEQESAAGYLRQSPLNLRKSAAEHTESTEQEQDKKGKASLPFIKLLLSSVLSVFSAAISDTKLQRKERLLM